MRTASASRSIPHTTIHYLPRGSGTRQREPVCADPAVIYIDQQPICTLRPDLGYFRERLKAARDMRTAGAVTEQEIQDD
jgi:hypothetical protein